MDLHSLSRKDLQALAKQHGVKANQSSAMLIEVLSAIIGTQSAVIEEPTEVIEKNLVVEQPVVISEPAVTLPPLEEKAIVTECEKEEVTYNVHDRISALVDGEWMEAEIKRINKTSYRVILLTGIEKTVKPSEIKPFEETTPATEEPISEEVEEAVAPTVETAPIEQLPQKEELFQEEEEVEADIVVEQQPEVITTEVELVEPAEEEIICGNANSPMIEEIKIIDQPTPITKISFPTEEELNNDASRHSICLMIDELLDFDVLEAEEEAEEEKKEEQEEVGEVEKVVEAQNVPEEPEESHEEEAVSTDEIDAILSQVLEDDEEEETERSVNKIEIMPEEALMESIKAILEKDEKEEVVRVASAKKVIVQPTKKQVIIETKPGANIKLSKGVKRSVEEREENNDNNNGIKNPFTSMLQQQPTPSKKAKLMHKPLVGNNNKAKVTSTPSYLASTAASSSSSALNATNKRGSLVTPARNTSSTFTPKSTGAIPLHKQKDAVKKFDPTPTHPTATLKNSKSVDVTKSKASLTSSSLSQSKQKTTPTVKSFLSSTTSSTNLTASTGFAATSAFLNKDSKVKFENDENDVKKINRPVATTSTTTTTEKSGVTTKNNATVSTPNFKKMHEKQFHQQKSIANMVSRKSDVVSKMDDAFSKAIMN